MLEIEDHKFSSFNNSFSINAPEIKVLQKLILKSHSPQKIHKKKLLTLFSPENYVKNDYKSSFSHPFTPNNNSLINSDSEDEIDKPHLKPREKRVKERTISYVREKVNLWRTYYE